METTLIQLVSEQTMPNVIGALVLRPRSMVLLHTDRTVSHCGWIQRALAQAGLPIATQLVDLGRAPGHIDTGRAVRAAVAAATAAGTTPVINITGGTKLMSIGAFAAANATGTPNFYLDVVARRILAGTSIPLPAPLDQPEQAFGLAAAALTVAIVTAAHGVELNVAGRDAGKWLASARVLAADSELEAATHAFTTTTLTEGRRHAADYVRLLETPLDPLPDRLIEALAMDDHLVLRDGRWHLFHPEAERIRRWRAGEQYTLTEFFQVVAPLQAVVAFLSGGWWELIVLESARQSGRFRDLQWSAQITRANGSNSVEEDILAVEDLGLAVISCKRGGERNRTLRAFEELESAGRQLGGAFANCYLALAQCPPFRLVEELSKRSNFGRAKLIYRKGPKLNSLFQ